MGRGSWILCRWVYQGRCVSNSRVCQGCLLSHRRVGPDIYQIRRVGRRIKIILLMSGPTYWYYFVDGWAEGVVKYLLYIRVGRGSGKTFMIYTGGPKVVIYCIDG